DVVKGGLVVDVGVRGFIPASHVERHFVEDFSDYKGRTLSLKVIELDKEKNTVILSHRAVLEEEVNVAKKKIYDEIHVGEVIEGTVQRLTDFGAFVDVGGVDGLVHISELAWGRVDKPSDVVSEGDKV
ncbi:S1 RNA-binding domain-containing protein, partial [Escherichia coli]